MVRPRAWLNLRYTVPARRAAFVAGLASLGFLAVDGIPRKPEGSDIFVTWNRIGDADAAARRFESAGNAVVVAENASWGNEFAGESWYTIARSHHNTAGNFPVGDSERWDSLAIDLLPWRTQGETVILLQRGIGSAPVAMPRTWGSGIPGRTRQHPGIRAAISLEADLARAGKVITWGSGAAIKALMWGIPVESHMPNWIAEQDNTDNGRLEMFRRLAWAQWRLSEITDGIPFRRLLDAALK
ncbi:MAG: hypothetical protein Q8L20_10775 [Gammaproteobacteria bacterium]|nr:hypothetical protein [Gammaproteobacteria bacterium]